MTCTALDAQHCCLLPCGMQAWVYVCEELQEVVVAFRGTEQASIRLLLLRALFSSHVVACRHSTGTFQTDSAYQQPLPQLSLASLQLHSYSMHPLFCSLVHRTGRCCWLLVFVHTTSCCWSLAVFFTAVTAVTAVQLLQVKWKDLVSDLNLVPTTMDEERTGAVDLGLGNLPLPFAKFRKSECVLALAVASAV